MWKALRWNYETAQDWQDSNHRTHVYYIKNELSMKSRYRSPKLSRSFKFRFFPYESVKLVKIYLFRQFLNSELLKKTTFRFFKFNKKYFSIRDQAIFSFILFIWSPKKKNTEPIFVINYVWILLFHPVFKIEN